MRPKLVVLSGAGISMESGINTLALLAPAVSAPDLSGARSSARVMTTEARMSIIASIIGDGAGRAKTVVPQRVYEKPEQA
jgi:hypothetical protein